MKRILYLCMAIVFIACHKNNDEVPQPDPNKPTPDKPIPDKPKPDNPKPNTPTNAYLYGITIDDSWEETGVTVQQIVSAIKAMPVKPTVRIVMSKGTAIADYKPLFSAVHQVAYVMATPADSEDMKGYKTVDSYVKRFQDSYKELSAYTDFWEVGNEINGEGWMGDNPQFIADKAYGAYKFIRSKNAKTVLVSYYFKPGDQKVTMEDWLKRYIPEDMKKQLDYVLVSYYEDDNGNYQPNWQEVFNNLESIFPSVKLGIGECGNNDYKKYSVQSKVQRAKHYYSMPKYVKNYAGGYFWWYWVQDCVPHQNSEVFKAINSSIKQTLK